MKREINYTGLKDKDGVKIYEGDEVAYFYEHWDAISKFKTIEEMQARDKSKSKLDYDIGIIQMVNGHYMLVEKNGNCAPISAMLENINDEINEHSESCYYEVMKK